MSQLGWRNLVKEGFSIVLFLAAWFVTAGALIGGGAFLFTRGVGTYEATGALDGAALELAGGAALAAAGLFLAGISAVVVAVRALGKSVAFGLADARIDVPVGDVTVEAAVAEADDDPTPSIEADDDQSPAVESGEEPSELPGPESDGATPADTASADTTAAADTASADTAAADADGSPASPASATTAVDDGESGDSRSDSRVTVREFQGASASTTEDALDDGEATFDEDDAADADVADVDASDLFDVDDDDADDPLEP